MSDTPTSDSPRWADLLADRAHLRRALLTVPEPEIGRAFAATGGHYQWLTGGGAGNRVLALLANLEARSALGPFVLALDAVGVLLPAKESLPFRFGLPPLKLPARTAVQASDAVYLRTLQRALGRLTEEDQTALAFELGVRPAGPGTAVPKIVAHLARERGVENVVAALAELLPVEPIESASSVAPKAPIPSVEDLASRMSTLFVSTAQLRVFVSVVLHELARNAGEWPHLRAGSIHEQCGEVVGWAAANRALPHLLEGLRRSFPRRVAYVDQMAALAEASAPQVERRAG